VNVADDWKTVLDFIGGLSGKLLALPEVREVKALALSNTGQHLAAIAELETVVATDDPSPERLGLLGGRYKRLWRIATAESERLQYLNQAINHYERGMELDLNEYFCSCNLPRLYRQRNRKGDEERAQSVLRLVIAACERAKRRGATDEFLRPTLLGAAFDVVDADLAEELAHEVQAEGAALWKIDSTLADLESSVLQVQDASQRARLEAVISRLKA
ncbi:MAG TPA: tetratricopeptide repeat-containing protein, partial [Solimonas sp.]|nr:tetratricopeptide repeat-containing protein [Solimonas sp.]